MSESQREIYNAASKGVGKPTTVQMACFNCGGIVTFHLQTQSDPTANATCDTCDDPYVSVTALDCLLGIARAS